MKKPYHIVNSKKFLDVLLNYVLDHIKHFRCYPFEFWYEDKNNKITERVYKFRTIMRVLKNRKQQASEQKG